MSEKEGLLILENIWTSFLDGSISADKCAQEVLVLRDTYAQDKESIEGIIAESTNYVDLLESYEEPSKGVARDLLLDIRNALAKMDQE